MSTPRTRAWRRAQSRRFAERPEHTTRFKPPKKWSQIYWRSNKLDRARQIGRYWPHAEWIKLMTDAEPVKILFVCSRNQWRSPTAERVWSRKAGIQARSAGTSRQARRRLRIEDIRWADMICVMEDKHAQRIRADFRQEVAFKPIHILDIPDDYQFMDPELDELILSKTETLLP